METSWIPQELRQLARATATCITCPSNGHKSLDRIDNNGNYEPGNCRWADQPTQQRNRSTNKLTQTAVDSIKGRMRAGERVSSLAIEHGVSEALLYAIRSGQKWKTPRPRARINQGGSPQPATQAEPV